MPGEPLPDRTGVAPANLDASNTGTESQPAAVRVIRSGVEESTHLIDAAVVDVSGDVVAAAGDPSRTLFARSSMKPLQAAVSSSLAAAPFTPAEIAVMCGSHNAEPVHVKAVRSILAKSEVPESALQCPARLPWDEESLLERPERRRINSDCSGKHAGMLAASRAKGWDLQSYRQPDHPLQRAIEGAVLRSSGLDRVRVGVDGCGVPVHALPLRSMATIYARLSAPARWNELEDAIGSAVNAMTTEPYMVAGRNRADTALMETVAGLVVKGGAEGLICAAVIARGLGVAVKVRDGASRAAAPALIRVLEILTVLDDRAVSSLAQFSRPPVFGSDDRVGELRAEFRLNFG
ncbi:MAG TPA: asparaginase [Actinomycetota bacterium]|nr:asparaginase [Actinomycetota bacterium]